MTRGRGSHNVARIAIIFCCFYCCCCCGGGGGVGGVLFCLAKDIGVVGVSVCGVRVWCVCFIVSWIDREENKTAAARTIPAVIWCFLQSAKRLSASVMGESVSGCISHDLKKILPSVKHHRGNIFVGRFDVTSDQVERVPAPAPDSPRSH